MAKDKPKGSETLPAVVDEHLPDWFLDDPEAPVAPYAEGAWEEATAGDVALVRIRNEKTGSGGGGTSADALVTAGVGLGEPYAAGGKLDRPVRLAGVPLLFLRRQGVAYREDEAWKRVGTRPVGGPEERRADEKVAIEGLLLVLAAEPFLGTYAERLRPALGYRSTIFAGWAKRLGREPAQGDLPAWARLAGRLATDPPKKPRRPAADGKFYPYRRERVDLAPLAAPELARLLAWLRSDAGRAAGEAIEAWRPWYADVPAAGAGTREDPFPAEGGPAPRGTPF